MTIRPQPRRNPGRRAALALLAVGCGLPVAAQLNEDLPQDVQEIGITERLDNQLPLELEFFDEAERPVRLADYFHEERPVLLSLAYHRCPMLCSLVLNGMLEALQGLDWTPGQQFEVVTVSIDPNESTQLAKQKKQAYLAAYGRPEADRGWHFLSGRSESIDALADALGFRFRYLEQENEFAHPAALFIVTPDGRVSRYLFGLKHDPQTLRLSLVEASEGGIGSPVDKFLLYCYRYDATKGRYAPVAMKIMRLGGALTALILGTVLFTLWRRDTRQPAEKRLAG